MSLFLQDLCGGTIPHLDTIPHNDPVWQSGKLLETTFSDMVDRLRTPEHCKNPAINTLMSLCWRIVGNRICPTSLMEGCPTMSFWCEARDKGFFATIICPMNWCQMLKDDPFMQLGALVYNASKVKDYWNLKIPGLSDTSEDNHFRAMAYESEFLNYCKQNDPSFVPNPYQYKVFEKFPNGLASAGDLVYDSRPFPTSQAEIILAGPPYPVDVYNLNKE